ncbi:DUF6518 family protein [Streptomyces sp. NPDC048290]|uniref:DUF6518 family protein n=1 Tax=Streptomyces sp. NPDC048290 TaxID=3155811 RepID=UPI003435448B
MRAAAVRTGVALLVGLLLGVLTNLAQGWLPGAWNQVANSGAVWCLPAFGVAAALAPRVTVRAAAVAGGVAALGLVAGYYGYAALGRDGVGALAYPLLWAVMAVIGGPLFGVAGHWWRTGESVRRRTLGLGALGGVFGMEAMYFAWELGYAAQAWGCLAVLAGVTLGLARRGEERVRALLTAVALAPAAYLLVQLPLLAVTA